MDSPRFGLGFRTQHFAELCASPRSVDWLELLSDSYLGVGGPRRAMLERMRADHPIALHGVGLGIASDEAPRSAYVAALRELARLVEPLFVSDHLCWTGLEGRNSHDLLPVAATRGVLDLVCDRVARVQDALGRRILLENASAYVKFGADEMSEAELLAALCERTGCGVLLDINNLVVNAKNLGTDPSAALAALDPRHVGYLHVAGHTELADVCVDTHGSRVQDEVWRLFDEAVRRHPHASVILERDDDIPPLAALVTELDVARDRWRSAQRAERETPERARVQTDAAPCASSAHEAWGETQRAFWSSLVAEDDGAGAAVAALDARVPVSPLRGLRVYRDALRVMPARALAANLPTLACVLSRRDFSALCAAFARAHPSRSHDYVRFGAALAEFLATFALADRYACGRAALVDIARLEQAQLEAQEAPDPEARVSLAELGALDAAHWESARFSFAPALRVVGASSDVLPAIRAVASGAAPALPTIGAIAYLVVREGATVHSAAIDPAGALALSALAAGATFAEACARAGGENAAPCAAEALAIACARGAVCAVSASGSLAPLGAG
ncbi:MAG TPA: DUF692 family multinuclear iron-containing protein [Myxococcota bacterium]|jgi:hypothetical protein